MKNLLPDDFNYDNISTQLDLKTTAGKEFLKLALQQCKLMDLKQQDYGSKNISSFGTFGVIVRMNDKLERIKNLTKISETEIDAVKEFRDIAESIQRHELRWALFDQIVTINAAFKNLRDWFGRKRKKSVNESIQDSFRDLSNYALIAVLLETGKWPNE